MKRLIEVRKSFTGFQPGIDRISESVESSRAGVHSAIGRLQGADRE